MGPFQIKRIEQLIKASVRFNIWNTEIKLIKRLFFNSITHETHQNVHSFHLGEI